MKLKLITANESNGNFKFKTKQQKSFQCDSVKNIPMQQQQKITVFTQMIPLH